VAPAQIFGDLDPASAASHEEDAQGRGDLNDHSR
jgi:hypothetical protein